MYNHTQLQDIIAAQETAHPDYDPIGTYAYVRVLEDFGHSIPLTHTIAKTVRGRTIQYRVFTHKGYTLQEIKKSPAPVFQLIDPQGNVLKEDHWFPVVFDLYCVAELELEV